MPKASTILPRAELIDLTIVHAQGADLDAGRPHAHEVNELTYIVRGRYRVEALGRVYEGSHGHLFCYEASQPHQPRFLPTGRDRVQAESILLQWRELDGGERHYPLMHHDQTGRIFAMLNWMLDLRHSEQTTDAVVVDRLLPLLLHELTRTTDQRLFLLQSVHTYIMDNIDQPIRIDDIADAVGLSKYHFVRTYARLTGMTPMRYVFHLRMKETEKWLTTTRLSLPEIACRVGVRSSFHLSSRFKQQYGCSPRDYRQHHTQQLTQRGRDEPPARCDLMR